MAKGNRTAGKSTKYSKLEEELIVKYYPKYGSTGLKGCINRIRLQFDIERTSRALGLKARKLGVCYRGKIKGAFKRGFTPYNKGKKMSKSTYEKCKGTMFKKGNKPYNTREDGDLSFRGGDNSHGCYWYIRLSLSKWVLLHRYVFEKSTNTILNKSDVVIFRDKDIHNVHPSNLELITRQENLHRNNPKLHYPPDIVHLIQLVNKLNRQIKKVKNGKE